MTPLYPCSHAGCGERLAINGLQFGVSLLPVLRAHGWGLLQLDVSATPKLYSTVSGKGGVPHSRKAMVAFCPAHTRAFGAKLPADDIPHGMVFGSDWVIAQRCAAGAGRCCAYLVRDPDSVLAVSDPPRGGWSVILTEQGGNQFVEFACPRDRRKMKQAERNKNRWTAQFPDGTTLVVHLSRDPVAGNKAAFPAGPFHITAVDPKARTFAVSPLQ